MSAAADPATRLGPFPARVRAVEPLGGLARILLDPDPRVDLGQAGQFHMVRNPAGRDVLGRPVGLIRFADGPGLVVDPASAAGDMAGPALSLVGPLGRGFDLSGVDAETTLLVAAGFGVTVMPAVAAARPGIRLVSGFRQSDHAALLDIVTGAACDAPRIAPDLVTEPLEAALTSGRYTQVLAAGPTGLGRAVAERCRAAGVTSQIALEAPMACGFGGCYGCAVELDGAPRRLCIEGPVVDGARLVA